MEEYKIRYNKLLTRYHNGCNYIKNHPKEADDYMDSLLKILEELNNIIINHPTMTKKEIDEGFDE